MRRFSVLFTVLVVAALAMAQERPRLVHVIVLDQFPAEYLERFGELYGEGGFRRFMHEGAWFANALYGYGASETGPGHATIATGTNPKGHGIIGNAWIDTDSNRYVYCVEDAGYALTDTTKQRRKGIAPHYLMAPGIGDALQSALGPESKVWSVALKDRAAVLLAGRKPDGAIWWTDKTGAWLSSRYYFPHGLPEWLRKLNDTRFADRYFHATWERALPLSAYAMQHADDAPFETGWDAHLSGTLPKIIGDSSQAPDEKYWVTLGHTPFANEFTFECARAIIENEGLGADAVTDFLGVSLSAVDQMGHLFGAGSHEALDMAVHTDRQLAAWLAYLDDRIGLEHCLIVLTSDHGLGHAPETLPDSVTDKGRYRNPQFKAHINQVLRAQYGEPDTTVQFVRWVDLPWAYLHDSLLTSRGMAREELIDATVEAAESFPAIALAFPSPLVSGGPETYDGLWTLADECAFEGRSGDVYLHLKPTWQDAAGYAGHGTANRQDRHVPMLFLGGAFRPGQYNEAVEIRDLAPTLCQAAGVPAPSGATGRILSQAFTR